MVVAEADLTAVAAHARWRASLIEVSGMFRGVAWKIWKWREAICGERS